jgi:hypothetical protein
VASNHLWVPPAQARRELEARRQYEAELQEQLVRYAHLKDWNRELKQIDPYLEVVWAPETANEVGGVKRNRYCLLRHNPTAPPLVKPLEIDGQYAELGSWVFDQVRQADLWRDEVVRDRKRMEERMQRSKERRRAREREERQEEITDRLHALNPSVSMTRAGTWSYRAAARKAGKRD